jgi:LPXTG-site transpeptidase (sortase) family protein
MKTNALTLQTQKNDGIELSIRRQFRRTKKQTKATQKAVANRARNFRFNIFATILIVTILASIMQLNLLGQGIYAQLNQPEEMHSSVPLQQFKTSPTPAPKETIKAFKPERIVISSIKMDLDVVSVPLKNGTWVVNDGVANYAEGTGLVSEDGGNVGIFGHDRTNAFRDIKKLLTGSDAYDIILIGNNYRATYKITSASVIAPTAINVFYPTKESVLTLITCEGLFSDKRYMVRAKLVKIEKINNE